MGVVGRRPNEEMQRTSQRQDGGSPLIIRRTKGKDRMGSASQRQAAVRLQNRH